MHICLSAGQTLQLGLECPAIPPMLDEIDSPKVGGGAMKKASIDNENWARLVQEIQQAKDAYDTVSAESVDVVVQAPEQNIAPEPSTVDDFAKKTLPTDAVEPPIFAQHQLTDNLDELLGSDIMAAENLSGARRSGIRSHMGWGIGGFLLGAICWHLVGFWNFVGDVVLTGSKTTTVVERNVEPNAKPRVLAFEKRRSVAASIETSRNCSAFYRDAETGLAHQSKCQAIVRSPGSIAEKTK